MQRLSTLVKNTPANIQAASKKVRVAHFNEKGVNLVKMDGRDVWEVEYKTSGTGESHTCTVKFFGPAIKQEALVWVSCDCEDFRYRLEYALTMKNSSDRLYSTFRPPLKTNPKNLTRLCKHLLKITGLIPQAQNYLRAGG